MFLCVITLNIERCKSTDFISFFFLYDGHCSMSSHLLFPLSSQCRFFLLLFLFGSFGVVYDRITFTLLILFLLRRCGQHACTRCAGGRCRTTFTRFLLFLEPLFFLKLLILTLDQCDQRITTTL